MLPVPSLFKEHIVKLVVEILGHAAGDFPSYFVLQFSISLAFAVPLPLEHAIPQRAYSPGSSLVIPPCDPPPKGHHSYQPLQQPAGEQTSSIQNPVVCTSMGLSLPAFLKRDSCLPIDLTSSSLSNS